MSPHVYDDPTEDLQKIRWPGLAAYGEADYTLFYGRAEESEELLRCVERETLTVIFGPSGVGKTSLLNAGLFPLLREKHYLPVRIRIDFSGRNPFAKQVKRQFAAAIQADDLEVEASAPPVLSVGEESLWEHFHRQRLWDDRNWPIIPVLLFDQFEELFTLGKGDLDTERLISDLSSLVENHIPPNLRRHLDNRNEKLNFAYQQQHYKVVLTLREDFVARLDGLRPQMPSVMHNRFYLGRMNGNQALSAVIGPGAELVTPLMADKIIRFVGDCKDAAVDLQNLEIEPALLSVVCRELNLRRIKAASATITPALLSGNQEAILEDFYERSIQDLPPDARIFIEDDLLTSSGYRNSMAVEDVLHKYDIDDASLTQLIDRRLLRMERSLRVDRVELIHDLLTGVVQQSRDRRLEIEAQAKERQLAAELQSKLRRSRIVIFAFASIAIVALYFMVVAIQSKNEITQNADNIFYNDLIRKARITASEKPRLGLLLIMEAMAKFKGETGVSAISAEETFREIVAKVSGTALSWNVSQSPNGKSGNIEKIAISDNGEWIAASGEGGHCLVWNISSLDGRQNPIELKGHREAILDLRFHPDNRRLATTGRDQTIRLWDLGRASSDGYSPIVLRGHGAAIYAIAFSPQGRWLASAGGDKSLRIWDLKDPANPQTSYVYSDFNNIVYDAAFSRNGRWLAAGSLDNSLLLLEFDLSSNPSEKIRMLPVQQPISSVDFSHDSKWMMACYDDGRIGLWDLSNLPEQTVRQSQSNIMGPSPATLYKSHPSGVVKYHLLRGHTSKILNYAFQSSGRWLATADQDRSVLLWDLALSDPGSRPLAISGETRPEAAVAFHPSGRWLASGGGNHTVVLWDTESEEISAQHVFRGFEGRVSAMLFNRTGSILAAASSDQTIRYWNFSGPTPTFEPIELKGHSAGITALEFSQDGNTLFSGSRDGTARVWDLSVPYFSSKATILKGHRGAVTALAKDQSSGMLATAGPEDAPRIWDLSRPYSATPPESFATPMQDILGGSTSKDYRWLFLQGADQKSWLVNIRDWRDAHNVFPLHEEDYLIRNTFLSSNMDWAAAAGWRSELYLRHIDPLRPISNWMHLEGHRSIGDKAIFSSNARLMLTLDLNGAALLWHLDDVQMYPKPLALSTIDDLGANQNWVFSPDDRWLINVSKPGKFAMWDLSEARPNRKLIAMTEVRAPIVSALFNPQGDKIVTSHDDFSLHVWSVDHGGRVRYLGLLKSFSVAAEKMKFSTGGRMLAVALENGAHYIWPDFNKPLSESISFRNRTARLVDIEFSGDDKWVLLQYADNTAQLFASPVHRQSTAERFEPSLVLASKPNANAFSPDSRWLASIHPNGDLYLTPLVDDETTGPERKTLVQPHLLRPSSSPMMVATFDHAGHHLIAADQDGVLYRWALRQEVPWSTAAAIPGDYTKIATMAFLPAGQRLAIEDDTEIQVHDLGAEGRRNRYPVLARLKHHKEELAEQWSDDDRNSFVDKVIKNLSRKKPSQETKTKIALDDLENDRVKTQPGDDQNMNPKSSKGAGKTSEWVADYFANTLERFEYSGNQIHWSRDGRTAARLNQIHQKMETQQEIAISTLSESGRFIRIGKILYEQADNVSSIALSPSGRYLALGFNTGKVGSLDLNRPISKDSVVILGRHNQPQPVDVIAFSPEGKWLASGSRDTSIVIWPVDTDSLIDGACRTVGRSMSAQEWEAYMQDRQTRVSCDD
jgi:WD40 repeat protein